MIACSIQHVPMPIASRQNIMLNDMSRTQRTEPVAHALHANGRRRRSLSPCLRKASMCARGSEQTAQAERNAVSHSAERTMHGVAVQGKRSHLKFTHLPRSERLTCAALVSACWRAMSHLALTADSCSNTGAGARAE
jgi:hypothetical protein